VILERRGNIPHLPSHSEQKKGSGPNMLEGEAADGPFVPSSVTSSISIGLESPTAVQKRQRKDPVVESSSKKLKTV
jgi:hypothetical protein